MSDKKQQAEDLTAFTDALLRGASPEGPPPPLASTVEMLSRALIPLAAPDELRRTVRRRIVSEWRQSHPAPIRRRLPFVGWARQRWAWAAVAAVVTVALAAAWLLGSGAPVTGTAVGGSGWIVPLALIVLAGVLALVWWLSRRNR